MKFYSPAIVGVNYNEQFLEIGKGIHMVKMQLDEPRDYKTDAYSSCKMLSIDFGGIMR